MKRILAVLSFLCVAGVAHAQTDRATLTGTVRDAQGGVLSGASVVVTSAATNVATRVKTNAEGNYLAVNLVPGKYTVEAEAAGFEKKGQALILEVGQRARIDFTLGVGQITEAVTVQEVQRPLNTENAILGTVVEQSAVANLPLAIRNWDDLLALVAGVQGDRFTEQGAGTSFGRTGGVNVHGNRSLQNNFLLDGVDNNSISTNVQELTTQVSRPSIDSIQEFKIVTSPYSAEYGRSPGAAISVTTKSGTNQIRGTAYEYFRNESLDSNDYFSKLAKRPVPTNDQNQFGGNLGGPIVKDKAFFFVDYEGTRITRGVIRSTRVPTLAERQGIFTSTIRDPLTGLPFPGNTIPANRIDSVAAAMFQLLPAPNQPGATNFFRQADVLDDADRILTRIDLKLTDRDNVFARYFYSNRDRFVPGLFGEIIDGTSSSSAGRHNIKGQSVVAGWTRVLGPSMVNEFRFSWVGADSDGVQDPFGQAPPASAVVPGVPNDPRIAGGLTGVELAGFFSGGKIGSPNFLPKFQHTNQFEFLDTLSWIQGDHQFKFGFDILAPMKNFYMDVPSTRGNLQISGQFTGSPVADFLLGYVFRAEFTNIYAVDQRHWATSFFAQDDWKPTSKLTLNLGLRYDFITPALEAQNRQTNFIPEGEGRLIFAKDGSLKDRALVNPDYNNFAPRVGIVFQANQKTVLRAGYGIFYNLFDRIGSEDQIALNPPGLVPNSLQVSASERATPVLFLRNGFPANFLDPNAPGLLRRVQLRAAAQDASKTMIHQVSAGVQREFFGTLVVSVDGILSYGRHLARLINLNQPIGGSGPLPFPNFGGFIEWREQTATSRYKGMDLSIEKRFSKGYGLGIAYTLSNSRDEQAEHLAVIGSDSFSQDARSIEAWEGPSEYDVRQRFVTHFVGELPFGKNKKWAQSGVGAALLGSWTFSGIYTARSGLPFTVRQTRNNVGQRMTGLPNLVGNPEGPKTLAQWFNVSAFQAVPSGTFGNAGRNILRGPGWSTFDFSLTRRIDLGGRVSALLRWDVFNAFNRANFGLPNRDISGGAAFGTITSLAGDARLMQLAVRLSF